MLTVDETFFSRVKSPTWQTYAHINHHDSTRALESHISRGPERRATTLPQVGVGWGSAVNRQLDAIWAFIWELLSSNMAVYSELPAIM